MLSMQAQSQLTANLKINDRLLAYLRELLYRLSTGETPSVDMSAVDDTYNSYTLKYTNLKLDEVQTRNFFTPLTCNLQALQIRQIVREIGETTGKRGCGVQAIYGKDGNTEIVMTLWERINPGFETN